LTSFFAAVEARAALARRTGTETCWASFATSETSSLCVSRAEWNAWQSGRARCAEAEGGALRAKGWRVLSPPENSLDEEARKLLFTRQLLPRVPCPRPEEPVRRLEHTRERVSAWLAPHDPHGVLRKLVVDERVPGSPAGLLRTLGFVHLVTAAGIHLYALASWTGSATAALARLAGL